MKFTRSDAAVTIVTIVLAGLLLYLFSLEFNRTVYRGDMESAGNIVFRRRVAVRRSVTGLIWERIQNNSPVYNGDILRTGDGAEAAILFEEGGGIDLFENTMLELNVSDEELNFAVQNGSFVLTGSGDPAGMSTVVTLQGQTITLSHDAAAAVILDSEHLELDVCQGSLSIQDEEGNTDSLENGQGLSVDLVDGTREVVNYSILPEDPVHNKKMLKLSSGTKPVRFFCTGDTENAVLEIAEENTFSSTLWTDPVTPDGEAFADLDEGVYFWRIRKDENVSPIRRLLVLSDKLPSPVSPGEGISFNYRYTPPNILFSWIPSEQAMAYRLEIAKDRDFRNPETLIRTTLSSVRVQLPEEGRWYWRVIPEYPFETIGEMPEPVYSFFALSRSDVMEPPKPVSPLDGTLVSLSSLEKKGLSFSWQPVNEAEEYEVRIFGIDDDKGDLYRTKQPFLRLSPEETASYRNPGDVHWEVAWKDREEILSKAGNRRTLHVIESQPTLYLSYPPDGYTIADSLAGNTRFAWKSDIPARTIMEVSEDPDFNTIMHEEVVQAETLLGHPWPPGTYYWRISTYNVDGSVFMKTDGRSFYIIEPYPGPRLLEPDPNRLFLLREEDTKELRWQSIEEADYYRMTIVRQDAGGVTVYESPPLEDTILELPIGNYPSGEYSARIQAFSVDKPDSTRIIGYIGNSSLRFRILSYVELLSPASGEIFNGLEARRQGITFSWKTKNLPDRSELLIVNTEDGQVLRIENPDITTRIPRIDPGEYIWQITADREGFDISSRVQNTFRVLPVPPLPGAELTEPAQGTVIGPDFLRTQRSIRFDWVPVSEATHYYLTLYRKDDPEPLFQTLLPAAGFVFNNLPLLDRGEFRWTVMAVALDSSGDIDIPGAEAESGFSIYLPTMEDIQIPSGGDIYGR